MFTLRDYDKRDFEAVFKLDRLCFDPGIAYSRPELASYIEQRRAYTVVAEWNQTAPEDRQSMSPFSQRPAQRHSLQKPAAPTARPHRRFRHLSLPASGIRPHHHHRRAS